MGLEEEGPHLGVAPANGKVNSHEKACVGERKIIV